MSRSECRRFGLLDAMILVAATALGCGLAKWSDMVPFDFYGLLSVPIPKRYVLIALVTAKCPGTLLLVPWTLGLLLVRMRSPRPTTTQLFREPGVVATSTATLAIIAGCVWLVPIWLVHGLMLSVAFSPWTFFCGFAVAGGWLTLALSGRWRNSPGWIDRAGRLVGTAWFGLVVCDWIYDILT